MKLLKRKQTSDQRRRTASIPKNAERSKISNYYTPSTRTKSPKPDIEMNLRRETKHANRKKLSLSQLASRTLTLIVVLLLGYNLLYLRNEPLIVLSGESSTERMSVYEPAITAMITSSLRNTNKITLDISSLERQILEHFPELENAVVSTTLFGKRPIAHLYQQTLPYSIDSNANSYVVTENGVVAGKASEFNNVMPSIVIRDESGVEISKGMRVLRSDDALFLRTADSLLRLKGRALERVRLTSVPREAYLKLTDKPYELRVYLNDPADLQIASFFSAEKTLGERGETPATYIDLRAGEKVFWQ